MIMEDYKQSKPAAEKISAVEILGAVSFAIILLSLILLATI
jgi:hypothetical protein